MMRSILTFLFALLLTNPAWSAAGITQITVKDAGGTSRNFNVLSSDGALSGNLSWNNIICDPTTPTQCAAVDSSGRLTSLSVQSGTWTVQPGNTANTTPWLTTISQGGNSATVGSDGTLLVKGLGLAVTGASVSGTTMSGVGCSVTTAASGNANGIWSPLNCVPTTGQLRIDQSTIIGTPIDVSSGNKSAGTQRVTLATDQVALTNPLLVQTQAIASGGATAYTPFVPAASDNHQVVKNGAGTFYWIGVSNNSATKNYARAYDAGTGFNGCNSATGVIFAFEIPPNDSGFTIQPGGINGLSFSTGLSLCITSGFGLTDTTNATASAMYVNVGYK